MPRSHAARTSLHQVPSTEPSHDSSPHYRALPVRSPDCQSHRPPCRRQLAPPTAPPYSTKPPSPTPAHRTPHPVPLSSPPGSFPFIPPIPHSHSHIILFYNRKPVQIRVSKNHETCIQLLLCLGNVSQTICTLFQSEMSHYCKHV